MVHVHIGFCFVFVALVVCIDAMKTQHTPSFYFPNFIDILASVSTIFIKSDKNP